MSRPDQSPSIFVFKRDLRRQLQKFFSNGRGSGNPAQCKLHYIFLGLVKHSEISSINFLNAEQDKL